jgi:Fic family protein
MNKPLNLQSSRLLKPDVPLFNQRALEFLHQSNAIEGIDCFDYSTNRVDRLQGHAAAFLHGQQLATTNKVMSLIDLCYWQQLIVLEQIQAKITVPAESIGRLRSRLTPFNVGVGNYVPPSFTRVPELMRSWMRDLRNGLIDHPNLIDEDYLIEFCGSMLQRFEAIHPFVDGNGRVGRLVVNYLLTYWRRPIAVFRVADTDAFFYAHQSKSAMIQYMRKLIKFGSASVAANCLKPDSQNSQLKS